MLLDWEMPGMDGAAFMKTVRSPATFPYPDVPVIMLTGHGERSRVLEAVNLGVHEFLLKPVSSTALLTRHPGRADDAAADGAARRTIYGPEPRKLSSYKPEGDHAIGTRRCRARVERSPSRSPNYMIFVN